MFPCRETKTINIFVTLDIFALYMTLDGVWREIGGVHIFDNVQWIFRYIVHATCPKSALSLILWGWVWHEAIFPSSLLFRAHTFQFHTIPQVCGPVYCQGGLEISKRIVYIQRYYILGYTANVTEIISSDNIIIIISPPTIVQQFHNFFKSFLLRCLPAETKISHWKNQPSRREKDKARSFEGHAEKSFCSLSVGG